MDRLAQDHTKLEILLKIGLLLHYIDIMINIYFLLIIVFLRLNGNAD